MAKNEKKNNGSNHTDDKKNYRTVKDSPVSPKINVADIERAVENAIALRSKNTID